MEALEDTRIYPTRADGEFTAISYQRGKPLMAFNLWGTVRGESFPWLRELREALDRQPVNEAVLLAETYAAEMSMDVTSKIPAHVLKLPEVMHHLKNGNGDQSKIRLGLFDLASVNGKTANSSFDWRLQELESWVKDCALVHVLPYVQPGSRDEVRFFWEWWVVRLGYEGLFARDDQQNLYKVKKKLTLDAVIIGLNRTERWAKEEVTSFKIALLDKDGIFIEVGDVASGIDRQLRKALYRQLVPHSTSDHDEWVEVRPFVVVEVEATETFRQVKPRYSLEEGRLKQVGTVEAHSLRHPRLVRFRGDKTVVVEDIGYERQLPN